MFTAHRSIALASSPVWCQALLQSIAAAIGARRSLVSKEPFTLNIPRHSEISLSRRRKAELSSSIFRGNGFIGRNKEAQFRNNQINFLRCCLISADSWMARRAADVYHQIQSHPTSPRASRLAPSPARNALTKPIIIKVKTYAGVTLVRHSCSHCYY